jgi:Domain of unknown function (DUF4384)
MLRPTKLLLLGYVLIAGSLAVRVLASAHADDDSRAVNVIDAPMLGPAASPQGPVPSEVGGPILAPLPAPAARVPPSPVSDARQGQSDDGIPPQPANDRPETRIKVANAAGLSVEISPDAEIAIGTTVSFRISTRKEGYLLLLDVDATGKLTQIYPNPMSLMSAPGGRQRSNLVKPGKPVLIPDPTDAHAGFEFVASPPHGTAMVVALLSDRAVQMIDLPDLPANLVGQADALGHLSNMARELRIPSADAGRLQEARWSLDAKFYSVR